MTTGMRGSAYHDQPGARPLHQLGCRLGQGYHLGLPKDARETEELLRGCGAGSGTASRPRAELRRELKAP